MLIRKPDDIPSSEVTPKEAYVNRRLFMKSAVMSSCDPDSKGSNNVA